MKTLLVILFGVFLTASLVGLDTAYARKTHLNTTRTMVAKKAAHHKMRKGRVIKANAKTKAPAKEVFYELPHL